MITWRYLLGLFNETSLEASSENLAHLGTEITRKLRTAICSPTPQVIMLVTCTLLTRMACPVWLLYTSLSLRLLSYHLHLCRSVTKI